jgi:hypothetical protein
MSRKQKIVVVGFSIMLAMFAAAPQVAGQQSATGWLALNVNPRTAGVFVDDGYLGPASAGPYKVKAGERKVRIEDPRYEVFLRTISILPDKQNPLAGDLKPLAPPTGPFGTLRVQGPDKYAAVYLNGKYVAYVGEIDTSFKGLLVNPGRYVVTIEPLSNMPQSVEVPIEKNKAMRVWYK